MLGAVTRKGEGLIKEEDALGGAAAKKTPPPRLDKLVKVVVVVVGMRTCEVGGKMRLEEVVVGWRAHR